jgi:DNA polymerase-3 subunit delta'
MTAASGQAAELLARSLESGRVHSAYLFSGPGPEPREAALAFARALVCTGAGEKPCGSCAGCRRSRPRDEIEIDGTGRRGPLLRHIGDHPDLLWVERGAEDTRVRIGQVRELQRALRLRAGESERRAAVVADAEWLNLEAQNALLRLLEEPPPHTTLILVAATSAGLLATVRSRCQRVAFRPAPGDPLDDPELGALAARLDGLAAATIPELLDWAAEYRGARATAAAEVGRLLAAASAWLRRRVARRAAERAELRAELEAWRTLSRNRRNLAQRNANPQMVAESALLAVREVVAR